MDRLQCMRTFVAAVSAGGFSAVARRLDVPRSKVSKQIQALEAQLGVQLFVRTTRSLRLTEAGARYHAGVIEVLTALDAADEAARREGGDLQGILRLNAPVSFGVRVLAPLLPLFHARHPQIELHVALSDQLVDPVRGGFDLTIRIADLRDSTLVARLLMPAPRRLVASPRLLERLGRPRAPKDLATLPLLNYGNLQGGATTAFTRGRSVQRVHLRGPLLADNGDLLLQAAEAGMGIALLPDFITAEALAAGRLQTLLDDWQAPPIAVHALFPAARHLPRRTRALLDFLIETVAPKLR